MIVPPGPAVAAAGARGPRLAADRRRRRPPPAGGVRHRRALHPHGRLRPRARGRGSCAIPTTSRSTRAAACTWPTTPTTASCATGPRPATATGRAGARSAPAPGQLQYPRGIAVDARRHQLRRRSRATTGSTSSTSAATPLRLVRRLRPRGRPVHRAAGRRRGRERHARGRRLRRRARAAAQPRRLGGRRLRLAGARPDAAARPGRRRLRRGGHGLRARPAPLARARLRPRRARSCARSAAAAAAPASCSHRRRWRSTPPDVVYVADTGNGRIARFTTAGDYLGSVGSFGAIRGIAVAPDGSRIYAADAGDQPDHVLDAGRQRRHPDRPQRDQGRPAALARARSRSTRAGNVWVADRGNDRVQAVRARRHAADGVRRARRPGRASSCEPAGIAVDCHGARHRRRHRQQPRPAVPGRAGRRLRGAAAPSRARPTRCCPPSPPRCRPS